YQVLIDPDLLLKYDVGFDEVVRALHDNNLNVGGGALNQSGQMLLVHGAGRAADVRQIRDITVKAREGVPVRVGDVAEVRTGSAARRGGVTADGNGEVVLGLGFLLMGANGHEVTRRLQQQLDDVSPTLPGDVRVETVYTRTALVDQVIDTVRR